MNALCKIRMAHPFAFFAKARHGARGIAQSAIPSFLALVSFLLLLCPNTSFALAQEPPSCSLGRIEERITPQYPDALNGRVVQGAVQVQANFAPDGHVSSSKVISGPPALRFESEAYIRGWRAEKSDAPRACIITLDYRFDGSQGVCRLRNEIHVRAEREDETHVTLRVSCGTIW